MVTVFSAKAFSFPV